MKTVPLAKISMTQDEIEAVAEVIRSGWVSHGEKNSIFENKFANFIETDYGIATSSCYAALYAAISCLNIEGEIIVPSFTFGATVNAIVLAGATPVFADVDYETRNITAGQIRAKLTSKTKAVMLVHFGGQVCEMDEILEVVNKNNLVLIEDSAQTLGGTYKGKQAGSFGIGCFSFYATKNISTGEGGFITLNDSELFDKLKKFISHGIQRGQAKPWEREVIMAGANLRMSQIQAAIGLVQLQKIDSLNKQRAEIALKYNELLAGFENIRVPQIAPHCTHVFQMYTICVEQEIRDMLVKGMNRHGVMASVHFDPPVHLHSYYKNRFDDRHLPNTEKLSKEIISLPIYPDMEDEDFDYVCSTFERVYQESSPCA